MLNDDVCYRALAASDTRFDGLFFVAVSTTGIYCRPVCPAKKARRSSCSFFPSAAAAEREGYRPCLRCRPELAPGVQALGGKDDLGSGIVARIAAGALNEDANVESLAAEFGISSRQLRRLVREQTGVSPIELARTYRLPPSRLRKLGRVSSSDGTLSLRLSYRPPLDWAGLLAFLGRRAIRGVEHVEGDRYARTVTIGPHRGWLLVRPLARGNTLRVDISQALAPVLATVLARLRDVFDLNARPDVIEQHLAASSRIASLVRAQPGLRVPGAFQGFELAWRAILGQQVSVSAATTLAGRFALAFGDGLDTPMAELSVSSPVPSVVADSTPDKIAALGIIKSRARSIHALATLLADEPSLLDAGRPVARTSSRLTDLPGIGPWTASYIAMRALRWPDAFLDSDLGIKQALDETSPARIRQIAEPWRPWRAYAAMHLWTSFATRNASRSASRNAHRERRS